MTLDDEASSITGSGTDPWVAPAGGGLARVDASARQTIGGPIDHEAGSGGAVTAGEGALWLTDTIENAVIRADARTARAVGDPIEVPDTLRDTIVAGEGAVWVLTADAGSDFTTLVPITPATNRAGTATRVGAFAAVEGLAVGGGVVWVGEAERRQVLRIDPATRRIAARSAGLEEGISDVAYASGAVWALDETGSTVLRLDPATLRPVGQPVAVAAGTDSRLAVSRGAVWVLSDRRNAALRITWDD